MTLFPIISFIGLIIGIWMYAILKSRSVDNTGSEGFFLGGRSLTALPIAGTIIMTNLSTEQIVGQNGQSYLSGMQVMAWEVTSAIAIVALAMVFLPKYLRYGISTISDFIEIRYDTTTKRIISILFVITYMVSFLPVVLYSGSLVFNKLFRVDELLGVSPMTAIILVAFLIGLVGILYLLIGGLSLSANSDIIYGFGLLVVGLAIPIIGLSRLGDGNVIQGLESIVQKTPWLLNSVGSIDSAIVPWPTLFTGMMFNNLYFWCTNQMIVQKAFSGKNLVESQKGVLIVGVFKIFGALFLVFPGIVARNMFGDALLSNPDNAYSTLVIEVLPQVMYGVFAAVIFGAILSSFTGALNATATLFSLDFYKPLINKQANDKQVASFGKRVTIAVGVISIIVAPMIMFAPAGLYQFVQEFNGLYNMPLLVIILFAFYSKRATALGAKVTIAFHVVLYGLSKIVLADVHFLYVLSVLFFLDAIVLMIVSRLKPQEDFILENFKNEKVNLEPWKYTKIASTVIVITVILTYMAFSPLGLARGI
ncbi:solute:sodium symporter family transporter (plasmid) [Entomospira entomophila]|uniref:Solute:sodium symporter family transporter n=1 Tax=Entomospira entomophila TaxID=2719988 RepID=A0A968GB50_9SPIO|nr:solute:sodium symporter family transporter [Entomospira entomophilus]NIZ41287.1 solute:sodium symporter family transporter [Entomospira entomophilus]WDI36187.1 solute:sodium symporter family transporter [Entomospira entomophilus]